MLKRNPDAPLEVYAVWEKALPTDTRAEWDATVLDDLRVTHFWDPERLATKSLLSQDSAQGTGAHLDQFFVFGPDAAWDQAPTGLRDAGRNVLGRSAQLRDALAPLLAP